MGALTAKPQAFLGRPWEYDETFALDLYDTFGTNIIINTRGTSLIRIIPRINKNLNKFLITDKIRFSFDALTQQRILKPMINIYNKRTKVKKLITCTLRDILPVIITLLNHTKSIYILYGDFINIKLSSYIYNTFSQLFTTKQIIFLNQLTEASTKQNFMDLQYPESMHTFNKYKTIFLINTNLRQDFPLIHFYIQQLVTNNLRIFNMNSKHTIANTIAINEDELIKLQQGQSKILHYLKDPILFVTGKSSSTLLQILSKITNVLQQNGILCNILNTWLNTTQTANILLQNKTSPIIIKYAINKKVQEQRTTLVVFNATNYNVIGDTNQIYCGTHPNKMIQKAKLVFPLKHYFEQTGSYFNFQSVIQTSYRAVDNSEFFFTFYDILYLLNQQIYNTYYKIIYKKSIKNLPAKV